MTPATSGSEDRRKFRRSVVGMPVHAVRRSAPADDPSRLVGLHIMNVSRGGIGAITQQSLAPAEPVVLFLPPLGPGRGSDTFGQVVRCEQCGDQFAIGIAFDEPWPEHELPVTQ